MHLSKLHGLGNDFLVTFAPSVPLDGPELARRLCHRTHGIGADGLVVVTDCVEGDDAIAARFTLFNSDGSRAAISGNGLRCFAHAIARRHGRSAVTVAARTPAGVRRIDLTVDDEAARSATASVAMGLMEPLDLDAVRSAELAADLAGFAGDALGRWATGDLGNPHIVVELEDPFALDLVAVGTAIEKRFMADSGGVNVHLIGRRRDGDGIDLRVWERGAGVTEACGSGACAAGVLALQWGLAASPVTVHMPGGSASVALDDAGSIVLTGPSVHIAEIEAP